MKSINSNRNQTIQKMKNQIIDFDTTYLDDILNQYSLSEKLAVVDSSTDKQYREQLIQKIVDSYYTFQQETKNKKFGFIKNVVFKQLFKYVHRQIHFNDYLKSIIQIFNEDIINHEKTLMDHANAISQMSGSSDLSFASADDWLSLHNRVNALYEMQKRTITGSSKVVNSPGSGVFYSQFGEDEWVVNNLKLPKKGFFIDVGAADGVTFSNSYYFEKQGWEGICFEPNPENFLLAKKYRKQVFDSAISSNAGSANFYIDHVSTDWSGLTPTLQNKSSSTISVKTQTLNDVLKQLKIRSIDLLSIDVEGTEIDVLQSLDIDKYRPTVLIVEYLTKGHLSQQSLIESYLKQFKYSRVFTTKSNLIFTKLP